MRIYKIVAAFVFCFPPAVLSGQDISAPTPQPATLTGTATDTDGDAIPGAEVILDGPAPTDHRTATTNGTGFFTVNGLRPAVPYHVTVRESGFADWTSPEIVLSPGQSMELSEVKLKISIVETSVSAVTVEQLAIEQVKNEEKQRVFGIIPNFYTVYDPRAVPLTTKLKFHLAMRSSIDVATLSAVAFAAGLNQAADSPSYVQGAKGYGQRYGAIYADGVSDILFGGAILPSLLHQDPRYFYQGTGTKKSRALHAIASPFWCKGDDGTWQFNYSSIGGDLISGSLSNFYYPDKDRGIGLVGRTALVATGGRMVNSLVQEFILRKFTSHSDPHD